MRGLRAAALVAAVVATACSGGTGRAPASSSVSPSTSVASAPPRATAAAPISTAPAPSASPFVGETIDLHEMALSSGALAGTVIGGDGGLALAVGPSGTWVSAWYAPARPFTRLVPSWVATTPAGTWLTVDMQARTASGADTRWWSFGTWASGDADVRRASVPGQEDASGSIDVDTFVASEPMGAYRLRLTLMRTAGTSPTPSVRRVRAVTSGAASPAHAASTPLGGAVDLAVPAFAQEIHAGQYGQYDGGGEAWCSPTSTAMVLAYWGRNPTGALVSWVDPSYADPQVDAAARWTYDASYDGTGNWPFNTAYAASLGLDAFVTRLRSLAEAERFVRAGIPLVASVKVAPGALPGFLLPQGTDGHLLVIRGFTASGDVIVNDPAATSDASVRRVYPRAAFERAWLEGSNETVYVIHPDSTPLPALPPGVTPNW